METRPPTLEHFQEDTFGRFVSVRKVRVSFLQREALVPIRRRPVPEFDLAWEPGALEALLDATAASRKPWP